MGKLILEPSLHNLLVETLAESLNADQVEAMGKILDSEFNIYEITGTARQVTLGANLAARELVKYFEKMKKMQEFIKLVVEMDGTFLLGKEIHISGLESFLLSLANSGFCYESSKRQVVPTKDSPIDRLNWGALKSGKDYDVTVASMDIVGSSELVRKFGRRTMENFYSFYWSILKERIITYNGRIWSWAGDGGILAFTFKEHHTRAVQFAIEMQRLMPLINTHSRNPINEDISIRIGMNSGKIGFMMDTGKIISDVINLAAHLEKKVTGPGQISISAALWENIVPRIQEYFMALDDFEGQLQYRNENRLDLM